MKSINLFHRHTLRAFWLILGLLGSVMAAQAGTSYFLGAGTGATTRNWNVAANWSPNSSGGGANAVPNCTNAPGDNLVFGTYSASEGSLKAFLSGKPPTSSGSNYYAASITTTCNGWLFEHNGAFEKILLGSGGIQNNNGNAPSLSSGSPPGQNKYYTPIQLQANCTIYSGDLTNSAVFRLGTTDTVQTNDLDLQGFTVTFDGPGAISFAPPQGGGNPGGVINGSGGVIKNGMGTTTFSTTNYYTGPTVVNAGTLYVSPVCFGGGSYTVADGATLGVTLALSAANGFFANGNTLNTSLLSITNAGNANTNLIINLSSTGNPTVPVVHAITLNLNGTCNLLFAGSGLAPGTIPLIKYDSATGTGTFAAILPTGVVATLNNNTTTKTWELVITQVPSLLWTGKINGLANGIWNINTLTNWYDTAGLTLAPYNNALPLTFDDTAGTKLVTISATVTPYSMTVNTTGNYTFTNNPAVAIPSTNRISGTANIIKNGAGTLTLACSNSYTGFTAVNQGTLLVTADGAIGVKSTVTNNGTLDLNGTYQFFADLYGNGTVINGSVNAANLVINDGTGDSGAFAGQINDGAGQITLHKQSGVFILSGNNNYSGGTIYEAGGAAAQRWIIVANNNALGSGPVTVQVAGTLTADASPRTINNTISLGSSFQFGNAGAGVLTCAGPIQLQGASGDVPTLTFSNDIVFSGSVGAGSPGGPSTSGWQTKSGPGTLRLQNSTCSLYQVNAANSDFQVNGGNLIIDNETMTVVGVPQPKVRVQNQDVGGTSSLMITNNGSLTVGNQNAYYRLRIGDTSSPTNALGQQTTTNIVDVRGTLIADGVTVGYSGSTIITNNPGPTETYVTNYNGGGAYARLNLQPGSQATLNQISSTPGASTFTEVYLDGATINVFDNASSGFLQGLTNAFIKSGGVTLNGQNTNSIHIRQNLLEGTPGGGGLTWNGTNDGNGLAGIGIGDAPQACMLQLDGTNTYTGTTLINVGILGGIGTLTGPLVFASGSSFYPGGGGNLGTVTVNNNVTMNSGVHCSFELNTTNSLLVTDGSTYTNYVPLSNTNDMLVVSGALTISGASLAVNNDGPTNVLGNYFKLFSKPAVGFSSVTLPGLTPGLVWANNLAVDGSISVGTSVTLTYDGNGFTGGTAPIDTNSPYGSGSVVTVLGNTGSLTNSGYNFAGWNTAANGLGTTYQPGATFTINGNTTLYAIWTPTTVTPPVLGVAKSGNTLTFTWSGAYTLQSRTNSLTAGIWHDIPGSSPLPVTIDPSLGSVFFRLRP